MRQITFCDTTIKRMSEQTPCPLTFREKIEVAKLLDEMGVDVIELPAIKKSKVDTLLVKSVAMAVKNATIAVPVVPCGSADETYAALSSANHIRLQVEVPVSTVGMEYGYHLKSAAMLESAMRTIHSCLELTDAVELITLDATRGDNAFLCSLINEAINTGVKYVTLCDATGSMFSNEFTSFLNKIIEDVPALKDVIVSVSCENTLDLADSCVIAAIGKNASEIKGAAFHAGCASIPVIAKLIAAKGNEYGLTCSVDTSRINNTVAKIRHLCINEPADEKSFADSIHRNEDFESETVLTLHDSKESIIDAAASIGYELDEMDSEKVYSAFLRIAKRKSTIGLKELDAIVATNAMQVPPTYIFQEYIATSGSNISSLTHIKLEKDGETLEGVALGGGPIEAAFLAIEQITGRHFELDHFQINAVTEGREAAGDTLVKLRSNGKLYAGRGISTDIIGASIRAYIIALNKILYEENE